MPTAIGYTDCTRASNRVLLYSFRRGVPDAARHPRPSAEDEGARERHLRAGLGHAAGRHADVH